MDFAEVYKWTDMTDDEKKEQYRNLLTAYRDAVKTRDAFVKLASRLSDY